MNNASGLGLLALCLSGTWVTSASAQQTFGVSAFGTLESQAFNYEGGNSSIDIVRDARVLDSAGYVAAPYLIGARTQAFGTENTIQNGSPVTLVQSSHAAVAANASLGSLHGTAGVDASISGSTDARLTHSYSELTANWADTFMFASTNPLGSDFTLGLFLDDIMSTSYGVDGDANGGYVLTSAFAGIRLQSSLQNSSTFGPTLNVAESFSQGVTNGIVASLLTPERRVATANFHVDGFRTVTIVGTMRLQADVEGVTGTAGVEASNTAQFFLSTNDPEAFYTTTSGTVYASFPESITPVPEPFQYAQILAGLAAVTTVVRRRRGRGRTAQ